MDHDLIKPNEINNDNTNTISYTFEEPLSVDNTTSAQSYVSHYSRIILKRRSQRLLRKRTSALFPFRRLPVQVSNNPFVHHIFNGSRNFN